MAGTSVVSDPTVKLPDPTKAAAGLSTAAVGKEQFLHLLVTQLRYQDPLNPMQGTEFTSQLAQFSALEQLISINKTLDRLGGLENAFSQSQAVGMLGKQVLAEGNTVTVSGGVASNLVFSLEKSSEQTLISIFDSRGEYMGVFDTGPKGAGQHSALFPVRDAQGNSLPDGVYTFKVQATGTDGQEVAAQTFSSGIVQGVKIAQGATLLTVGSKDIPLSNVVQITEPQAPPSGGPGI